MIPARDQTCSLTNSDCKLVERVDAAIRRAQGSYESPDSQVPLASELPAHCHLLSLDSNRSDPRPCINRADNDATGCPATSLQACWWLPLPPITLQFDPRQAQQGRKDRNRRDNSLGPTMTGAKLHTTRAKPLAENEFDVKSLRRRTFRRGHISRMYFETAHVAQRCGSDWPKRPCRPPDRRKARDLSRRGRPLGRIRIRETSQLAGSRGTSTSRNVGYWSNSWSLTRWPMRCPSATVSWGSTSMWMSAKYSIPDLRTQSFSTPATPGTCRAVAAHRRFDEAVQAPGHPSVRWR